VLTRHGWWRGGQRAEQDRRQARVGSARRHRASGARRRVDGEHRRVGAVTVGVQPLNKAPGLQPGHGRAVRDYRYVAIVDLHTRPLATAKSALLSVQKTDAGSRPDEPPDALQHFWFVASRAVSTALPLLAGKGSHPPATCVDDALPKGAKEVVPQVSELSIASVASDAGLLGDSSVASSIV
jgi:hypothetical protein